jgi:hypothetical protein
VLFGLQSLHCTWRCARRHQYEVLTWRVGKCYWSFIHILNVLIFNSKRRIYFHYTSVSSYGVIAWCIQPSKTTIKVLKMLVEVILNIWIAVTLFTLHQNMSQYFVWPKLLSATTPFLPPIAHKLFSQLKNCLWCLLAEWNLQVVITRVKQDAIPNQPFFSWLYVAKKCARIKWLPKVSIWPKLKKNHHISLHGGAK